MTLTGDPRRWANEPGLVGVVRYPDTHRWGEARAAARSARASRASRTSSATRAPHTIAAVFLETIVGHERHPHPARWLHRRASARSAPATASCMVADEVMAGFGRTGRWFAVDHWDVVPDLMTMAKGLTQLVPAAGRGGHAPRHRRRIRDEDVLRRPDLLATR